MRRSTRYLLGLALVAAAAALVGGSGRAAPATTFPGGAITFVDCCGTSGGSATGAPTKANPYPSTVNSNVAGIVGKVTVTVVLDHQWPDDVNLLLVGPGATPVKVLLMSDVGGGSGNAVSPDTLLFDDAAAGPIPDTPQLNGGTYDPSNSDVATDCDNQTDSDTFPAPAPAGPYASTLAAFNGTAASGIWSLYAIDDCNLGNAGPAASIQSWALDITGPTGVRLKNFSARRAARGVQLGWRTASETAVLGYNVYRFAGAKKAKVNRALIAAKGSDVTRGATYRLLDKKARRVSAYKYRLQVVNKTGQRFWLATASIRAKR